MRQKILQLLKENSYISGEAISEALGISRTAVWKHIKRLEDEGYQIKARRGAGYTLLSVPDSLLPGEIRPFLKTRYLGQNIIYKQQVSSTNTALRRLAAETVAGTVLFADEQTAGRGRLGRGWIAPAGTGIWMSLLLRPQLPSRQAALFTLSTAVGVAQALRDMGYEAGIKWPNDVLIGGRKVCGILGEMQGDIDGIHWLIMGIGINVGLTSLPPEIEKTATSLALAGNTPPARGMIAAAVLNALEENYDLLEREGFAPIRERWQKNAVMLGSQVSVVTPQGKFQGLAVDLDEEGCLVLEEAEGGRRQIIAGDILLQEAAFHA